MKVRRIFGGERIFGGGRIFERLYGTYRVKVTNPMKRIHHKAATLLRQKV